MKLRVFITLIFLFDSSLRASEKQCLFPADIISNAESVQDYLYSTSQVLDEIAELQNQLQMLVAQANLDEQNYTATLIELDEALTNGQEGGAAPEELENINQQIEDLQQQPREAQKEIKVLTKQLIEKMDQAHRINSSIPVLSSTETIEELAKKVRFLSTEEATLTTLAAVAGTPYGFFALHGAIHYNKDLWTGNLPSEIQKLLSKTEQAANEKNFLKWFLLTYKHGAWDFGIIYGGAPAKFFSILGLAAGVPVLLYNFYHNHKILKARKTLSEGGLDIISHRDLSEYYHDLALSHALHVQAAKENPDLVCKDKVEQL